VSQQEALPVSFASQGEPALSRFTPVELEAMRVADASLDAIPIAERRRNRAKQRTCSEEHKAKISAALKGRAVNGRVMSAEHKAAISRSLKWTLANRPRAAYTCSLCGESSHTKRSCPLKEAG
jgi:hypothetical protein